MISNGAKERALIVADFSLRLADGRTALDIFEEERVADKRYERGLLVKEIISILIVIAIVIVRQLWFV